MAGLANGVERAAQLGIDRGLLDQLEDAEHAVQWRADFVAHGRQEIALGEVRAVRRFLRLVEAFFQRFPAGNVLDRAAHAHDGSSRIHMGQQEHLQRLRLAIRPPRSEIVGLPFSSLLRPEEGLGNRLRPVLEQSDRFGQVGGSQGRIAPEHLVDLRGPGDCTGRQVACPVPQARHGVRVVKPLQRLAQRLLGLLDRRDVGQVAVPHHVAIRKEDGNPRGTHPANRAVGFGDPEVHFQGRQVACRVHNRGTHAVAILVHHHLPRGIGIAKRLVAVDAEDLHRVDAEKIEGGHACGRAAQDVYRAGQAVRDRAKPLLGTRAATRLAYQPPEHRHHQCHDRERRHQQ